jgi:hypothetical protein
LGGNIEKELMREANVGLKSKTCNYGDWNVLSLTLEEGWRIAPCGTMAVVDIRAVQGDFNF